MLTDEKAAEIIEEGFESALEAEVEEITKNLPEEAKNVLRIATKGGDLNGYLKTLKDIALDPINKDTDMSLEDNQVLAVTLDLKEQGYDEEYIESHIQTLKDTNKLESISKKVADKRVAKQQEQTAQELKAIKEAEKANKEKLKKYKETLTTTVTAKDNLNGLVINDKLKKALPSFIAEPSVELDNGKVITEMQYKLFQAMADPEKNLLLGALLYNDFDFSSITAATLTQYAKDVRNNITNTNLEKDKTSNRSSHNKKRELIDLIG